MMFRFAYPAVLFALAVPAAWLAVVSRKKPPAVTYSMTTALSRVAGGHGAARHKIPPVLRAGCMALLVVAAARPQLYNVSHEIRSHGVDIVLCLDTSGSMRALDFQIDGTPVTRLAAVKKVVADFIKKRPMDRIGLVVFGEEAFTQCPLTLDKGLLLNLVDRMEIGMAGDRTAIGSAIAVAGKRLKDLKAKSKILILLTDGRHNAGELSPEEAARAAHVLGIKIYTIGVGGKGPAPFQVQTVFGTRIVHQQVDLDEQTLNEIARIGGGRYFRASDSAELSKVYDMIDRAEKTEIKLKEFFHFRELYAYFLVPALILCILEVALKATALRVIP